MVILVVFNSFNVVKNLKKPDPVARQMAPLYTTLIKFKCLCYNKNHPKRFDENSKKRVFNTYKFSSHDLSNFILLLRKG